MFPKNAWYVACTPDEVDAKLASTGKTYRIAATATSTSPTMRKP